MLATSLIISDIDVCGQLVLHKYLTQCGIGNNTTRKVTMMRKVRIQMKSQFIQQVVTIIMGLFLYSKLCSLM